MQAVLTSIAAALVVPSRRDTAEAMLGQISSGSEQPRITRSIWSAAKPGAGQRPRAGHLGHFRHRHVGDAPLLHAGPADDPFVVGVEEGGQIGVGQDGGRHPLAPPDDRRMSHSVLRTCVARRLWLFQFVQKFLAES